MIMNGQEHDDDLEPEVDDRAEIETERYPDEEDVEPGGAATDDTNESEPTDSI